MGCLRKSVLCILGLLTSFVDADARDKPGGDSKKFTICTTTLNSSEEKEIFRKYLNPKQFQFVELTDFGAKSSNIASDGATLSWLDHACKSGIECDVNLISGHFGGRFFGRSGLSLSLEELEAHSCRADCKGIFEKPREVFLFGCNTLAGKDPDHRTSDEYIRVLTADGISRSDAERISESRYGAIGASNRARMRHIFNSVPHLYGFPSVAPSGAAVKAYLIEYFKAKGDYAAYLTGDAVLGKSNLLVPNRELRSTLLPTGIVQCPGAMAETVESDLRREICALKNEGNSVKSRLSSIEKMVQGKNFLVFLPSIETFLRTHEPSHFSSEENEILDRIKKREESKRSLLETLSRTKTPMLKIDLVDIAVAFGWISSEERKRNLIAIAKDLLKLHQGRALAGREEKDAVCSLKPQNVDEIQIRLQDLEGGIDAKDGKNALNFWSLNSIEALTCLKPKDPKIHELFAALLKDEQSSRSYRKASAFFLAKNPYADPTLHARAEEYLIEELTIHSKTPSEKYYLMEEMVGMQHKSEKLQQAVSKIIDAGGADGRNYYVRKDAIFLLGSIDADRDRVSPETYRILSNELTPLKEGLYMVGDSTTRKLAFDALCKLPAADREDVRLAMISALKEIDDYWSKVPKEQVITAVQKLFAFPAREQRTKDLLKQHFGLSSIKMRRTVIQAIWKMPNNENLHEGALIFLGQCLQDEDFEVSYTATEILRRQKNLGALSNPTSIIAPIEAAIWYPNPMVRRNAASALGALSAIATPSVVGWLTVGLSDADEKVRATSARALGHFGSIKSSNAIFRLLDLLGDKSTDVRSGAIFALGEIRSNDAAVHAALGKVADGDNDISIRKQALLALGYTETKDAVLLRLIAKAFTDKDASVRRQAASTLGQLKVQDSGVLLSLAQALKDSDADVQKEATEALRKAGPTDMMVLEEILKQKPDFKFSWPLPLRFKLKRFLD